jgi:ribokinase
MIKKDIIGLGALNIDHIYQVERILEDGEAIVDEAGFFPGGSAANTIYGLARLGIGTAFIGAIGDDDKGRLILQDFEKVGVDISQVKIKRGAKTGSTLCLSSKPGQRSLYVMPGANSLLTRDDLEMARINQAKMLHLSSFVDDRQFQILLELIKGLASSVRLSFSPGELYAARGLKALAPILAQTFILFINRNEILKLTGEDFKTGAEACLKKGCQIIVVTLGKGAGLTSNGTRSAVCYIRDASNKYLIEPGNKKETPAIDTTGAGDAFAAGFLYGLLNGKGLEQCGCLGDIVARFCINKVGARQGLPTQIQLSQAYLELYKEPW